MKTKLWAFGFFSLLLTTATMANDGRALVYIAMAAKQQNIAPAIPWIGHIRVSDRYTGDIWLADGRLLMRQPDVARSYNAGQYDVSRFYKPDRWQFNMLMHYAGRQAGEIFSFGFDSGFTAEKIKVKPAWRLGYTRAFALNKETYFALGMGGWFGGKVSEKPCLDSYDREYYCPTLTAWSDYTPRRYRLNQYFNLAFMQRF